jgi:hypothetical protein
VTDPVLNAHYQATLAAYEKALKVIDAHLANRTLPKNHEFEAERKARAELLEARRALWKSRF